MNSLERVMATLNHQPVDRTPIDCWLYQKQFLERLEADYGPREKFIEEFGIDVFVGLMPFPNQHGRKFDIHELAGVPLDDPRDPKWLNFTDWNYDFGGTNIATAEQKVQLAINRLQNLPDGADTQVLTFNFSDLPVIQLAVTSDLDPLELTAKLNASTIVELKKINDVSDASLLGSTTQRVVITPDPEELFARGLSNQSIRDALDDNGVLLPAGVKNSA